MLLQKREENAIALAATANNAKIIDEAIADDIPVSPKRRMIYLIALVLGVGIPVGIIYILETLSDIIQVGYFKLTHGKRFFKMAPLHHHLELSGWSEAKLVAVFSLVTLAGCVLAYLGVQGRF